jgi:hypothetical protein
VGLIGDKPDSHMLFMVGTNNLVKEHPEDILKKYEDLMAAIKERKYRKVSMVGILTRADREKNEDWIEYVDCKRFTVNMGLEDLCKENGFEYLDADIEGRHMLDWKGLHLNHRGQEAVAKQVFKHCRNFLN